jgi:methylated-DNA-[protein]-cysteine S-methyltransferase
MNMEPVMSGISRDPGDTASGLSSGISSETAYRPTLFSEHLQTPIGMLVLVTDELGRVRALDWDDFSTRMLRLLTTHYGRTVEPPSPRGSRSPAMQRVEAYFAGDLSAIDAIPVASHGTPFQESVWQALRAIPAGTTKSYGELAQAIGRPTAVRAVGLANGANPIGVIVPCHRVIGANATLTGYGGGLARKQWLLEHEGARSFRIPFPHSAPGRANE